MSCVSLNDSSAIEIVSWFELHFTDPPSATGTAPSITCEIAGGGGDPARRILRRDQVAQSARSADPHAPVPILSKRKAVGVVPDQPIILRKAPPAMSVEDRHARVFAHPQPAAMIHHQRHNLFRHQRRPPNVFGFHHLVSAHAQPHQILRWAGRPDISAPVHRDQVWLVRPTCPDRSRASRSHRV